MRNPNIRAMNKRARAADMVVLSISDVTTLSTAAIDAPIAVWVMSYQGAAPFPATNKFDLAPQNLTSLFRWKREVRRCRSGECCYRVSFL